MARHLFIARTEGVQEGMRPHAIRILGLDPGLGRMGWGAIDVEGSRLSHAGHGVLTSPAKAELGARLLMLHTALGVVIAQYRPQAIAVEQAFVAKDPAAALKLGHARAVALLAAAQAGLDIAEYAPNQIKKCVVGVGHAGKDQVMFMVRRLLPAARVDSADAADALAAAIAHAHLSGTRAKFLAGMR
jgi:crossover junction endodeoxyribonuclease RuvC